MKNEYRELLKTEEFQIDLKITGYSLKIFKDTEIDTSLPYPEMEKELLKRPRKMLDAFKEVLKKELTDHALTIQKAKDHFDEVVDGHEKEMDLLREQVECLKSQIK